jgi:glycerol uptake facilitator-like aquaporin
LNPAVSLAAWLLGGISLRTAVAYIAVQVAGAVTGVIVANLLFSLPGVELSGDVRAGGGILGSEAVATLGLVLVIFGVVRSRGGEAVAFAVGAYIGAAILFTPSTSFANPAATVARALTDTFAGVASASVPAFIVVQLVGAAAAVVLVRFIYPSRGRY